MIAPETRGDVSLLIRRLAVFNNLRCIYSLARTAERMHIPLAEAEALEYTVAQLVDDLPKDVTAPVAPGAVETHDHERNEAS